MTTQALPEISNKAAIKLLHILSEYEYDESVTEPISQTLKAMKSGAWNMKRSNSGLWRMRLKVWLPRTIATKKCMTSCDQRLTCWTDW